MAGKGALRPADDLVAPAVAETLGNLELAAEDVAAARLASGYAKVIDAADSSERAKVLELLGPKLLTCLESLGATPRARALTQKGGAPSGGGKLTALREARGA